MPAGLNGAPRALAVLPGVVVAPGLPHVLSGAPLWPVVGLTWANAVAGAMDSSPAASAPAMMYLRMCLSRAVEGCDYTPGASRAMRLPRSTSRNRNGSGSRGLGQFLENSSPSN